MKSIVIFVELIICSVLAYACSKSDKDSKAIQTVSNISLMSDNFKSEEDMEEYPHYLPVDSANRRMLDSCMLEHDTITFAGKKYLYTQFQLYPGESKCRSNSALDEGDSECCVYFRNYRIYSYETNDTTYSVIATPRGEIILFDDAIKLTIIRIGSREYHNILRKCHLRTLSDSPIRVALEMLVCDTIPVAKFGDVYQMETLKKGSWKSNYDKIYYRKGLYLKNSDGECNEWFLEYPYPANKRASKEEIVRCAKQLPPFLFYNSSDYYWMF